MIIRKWITILILSLLIICGIRTDCAKQTNRFTPSTTSVAPYYYSDCGFEFQIDVPEQWSIQEDVLVKATEEQEATPTCGINILIDGNPEDKIYVFGQLGTMGINYEDYEEEEIVSKAGEKGTLFRLEFDGQFNMIFVQENRHYGVVVNVNIQTYRRLEESILGVIHSLIILEDEAISD